MRIETVHPSEFGTPEWARWESLRASEPALASPYYAARWAQIVGAARADARVCVIEDGGRIEGFFAAQKLSAFTAMPLGAPLSDYQGIVGLGGDVTAGELCRALGVGRIDFTHVPATQTVFAGGMRGQTGAWIAELRGGAESYRADLKARRGETVRQWDKKLRKLEKDGPLAFTAEAAPAADFAQLIAWKTAQCRRTGQPPIWETPWVRRVADAAFASDKHAFGGALFTLKRGDTLIAANFCLRGASVLHCWIIAHDPAFDAYSPGVLLARKVVEWAADNHFCEVDFGPGDYQYKRQLATTQRALGWGFAARRSVAGAVRGAAYRVRDVLERAPHARLAALPGKAMRRLDVLRGLGAR